MGFISQLVFLWFSPFYKYYTKSSISDQQQSVFILWWSRSFTYYDQCMSSFAHRFLHMVPHGSFVFTQRVKQSSCHFPCITWCSESENDFWSDWMSFWKLKHLFVRNVFSFHEILFASDKTSTKFFLSLIFHSLPVKCHFVAWQRGFPRKFAYCVCLSK